MCRRVSCFWELDKKQSKTLLYLETTDIYILKPVTVRVFSNRREETFGLIIHLKHNEKLPVKTYHSQFGGLFTDCLVNVTRPLGP